MARRGRKRRLEIESEYWRLVQAGVGTVEACREVGIGRKTGYRWRAENGGLPPPRVAEPARSSRYLSLLERQRIATLRRDGLGVRAIAELIGRAPSTVSRELGRTPWPTIGTTTAIWPTPGLGSGLRGRGRAGCWPVSSYGRRWRPSWRWSGARSRSPRTCGARGPTGRAGTCATRRSIRHGDRVVSYHRGDRRAGRRPGAGPVGRATRPGAAAARGPDRATPAGQARRPREPGP